MSGFELVFENEIRIYRSVLGVLQTNCYLLVNPAIRHAVVVDPGDEGGEIKAFCQKEQWEIESIWLTHGHYDHICGLDGLRTRGVPPVLMHEADAAMLTDAHQNLSVFLGIHYQTTAPEFTVKSDVHRTFIGQDVSILHTPGHTPGGICFYMGNVLISGDTLFRFSVGRTDFPRGNTDQLMESIYKKLLILPDETMVFPGHGRPTTIGEEKTGNPYL